jgi:acyl dehydratase
MIRAPNVIHANQTFTPNQNTTGYPKVTMNSHTDRRNQPGSFDPVGFTIVPPRRFKDLRVGEVFRAPSRTLRDAHASAFQTVSADNHPINYDVEYARRHGHVAHVVHGLQVLAFTAPGATLLPQYIGDVFLAFTSASCKFLREVHAGDTLYPQLEIIKLTTQEGTGFSDAERFNPPPVGSTIT